MAETSTQTPAEGKGVLYDRNARKFEGGNRKRDKQSLEVEHKKLKRDYKTLLRQQDDFDNMYKELKRKYENELQRATSERVEYQKHIASLEHRHEELIASHIRSVSSIGTGLDPISDETFQREFRKLHDDVCFCP
jgi:hypothetical protein